MKFLLTIYLCSVATGECVQPVLEEYKIDQFYKTHYACVRSGLGESFELLFNSEFFNEEIINQWELYPRFSCEKIKVPPPKPKIEKKV